MFILPGTDLAEGVRIVERVFTRIRSARPLKAWPEFSYTCSAGVTALQSGDTAPEVFARADPGAVSGKTRGKKPHQRELEQVLLHGARTTPCSKTCSRGADYLSPGEPKMAAVAQARSSRSSVSKATSILRMFSGSPATRR